MKTAITIDGMHCGSCSALLRETLHELDGVRSAQVSHEDNTAIVEFDESAVTFAAIKKAIEKEGYKVRR